MENQHISLKKEGQFNFYSVYLGNSLVGTIFDKSKLNFWSIKSGTFCEIIINNKKYYLDSYKDKNSELNDFRVYHFSLFSCDKNKIADFKVHSAYWLLFFTINFRNVFFNRNKENINFNWQDRSDINYFEYNRRLFGSSSWTNFNNEKIVSFRNDNLSFNEQFVRENSEDLDLIIMLTVMIEKFIYRKTSRVFRYYSILVLLSCILIAFYAGMYTMLFWI